jgi:hypothetical protein
MIKNFDNLIKNSQYSEAIKSCVEKYREQIDWNELNKIDVYRSDNMFTEEIKISLENEKNKSINEFKENLVNDFNQMESEIKQKSKEIIINNFSEKIQQKIRKNEKKYFDRKEGEDKKQHKDRMDNQFKALIIEDYMQDPKNKVSLEMMKNNNFLKKMMYNIAEFRYSNILSKSKNEIQQAKDTEFSKLFNNIYEKYNLKSSNEKSHEKIEKNDLQKPKSNFIFESAKPIISKIKEMVAGISRYFMSL